MITLDTSIEEMHKLELLSVRAKNVCNYANITTFRQLIAIDKTELLGKHHCGRKTISEIQLLIAKYDNLRHEIVTEKHEEIEQHVVESDVELKHAERKYSYLSPQCKSRMQSWTQTNFANLTTRAQNIFEQYRHIPNIIRAIYADAEMDLISFRKCGKKTAAEFDGFLKRFKDLFEELTQEIDITEVQPQFSKQDIVAEEIGGKYPFLLRKECIAVADFILNNDYQPILFILCKYIYRNEDERFQVYKDFYGFNLDAKRCTLDEIANSQGLSRERVRQITSCGIPLPDGIKDKDIALINGSIGDIIAFDSPVWNDIKKQHMIGDVVIEMPLLLCSLSSHYTIVQIDDDDICYLVKRELVENVRVRNVCNSIRKTINARRSVVDKLDILSYIKSDKRKYHKDVKRLCAIYAKFISTLPNVNVLDDRYIALMPNTIDSSLAIESILSDKGVPMTLQELFDEFNKLHPNQGITSLRQFKPYIQRNPNIKPKGKRGIYVLAHWENQFTGTLVEYIEHVLRTCGEPIHVDDILDFVQEEFTDTTKKSVFSLLTGSYSDRFVSFEGNIFGLVGHQYDNGKLKVKRSIQRKSFDERFSDFKTFVSLHKRMPIASGATDEEDSLNRWMRNVQIGNVESTIEQSSKLKEFLDANSDLPQDGFEYKFKMMCDRVKVIVAQNFALPSRSEHLSEYNWLQKYNDCYHTYTDNRRRYFEELLSYLKDYGFYL